MKIVPGFLIRAINLSKIPWKWLVAIVLTITLIYGNLYIYDELTKLPPKEAVLQGLAKTLNAQSYTYRAVAQREIEGEKNIISDISGQKNLQGVHIAGKIPLIKAEIEVYQFNDKMYRKDSTSQDWLIVPRKNIASMEQFIAEINPLGIFNFTENMEVKYVGKEKVADETCRVYEIMTRGQAKYLELYWNDFNYILWLDRKDGMIRKAQISAEHRDNSQHILTVTVEIADFNKEITITPPQVKGE